ncbi:MAG: cytochrome c [Cyclobacteriaceae bacterium]|nr:cytochrome c [Cyclobacteriaceae bacterium]
MNLNSKLIALLLFILFSNCSRNSEATRFTSEIKFRQYYVQGQLLYEQHCSNCHQKDGSGLGLLYPPLNHSDYMDQNFEKVICMMKYGIKGELVINGKSYNKEMPGVLSLSDLEVTEIATYIYNTWSHQKDSIDISGITRILNQCSQQ